MCRSIPHELREDTMVEDRDPHGGSSARQQLGQRLIELPPSVPSSLHA